jgi:hypothetical protein
MFGTYVRFCDLSPSRRTAPRGHPSEGLRAPAGSATGARGAGPRPRRRRRAHGAGPRPRRWRWRWRAHAPPGPGEHRSRLAPSARRRRARAPAPAAHEDRPPPAAAPRIGPDPAAALRHARQRAARWRARADRLASAGAPRGPLGPIAPGPSPRPPFPHAVHVISPAGMCPDASTQRTVGADPYAGRTSPTCRMEHRRDTLRGDRPRAAARVDVLIPHLTSAARDPGRPLSRP